MKGTGATGRNYRKPSKGGAQLEVVRPAHGAASESNKNRTESTEKRQQSAPCHQGKKRIITVGLTHRLKSGDRRRDSGRKPARSMMLKNGRRKVEIGGRKEAVIKNSQREKEGGTNRHGTLSRSSLSEVFYERGPASTLYTKKVKYCEGVDVGDDGRTGGGRGKDDAEADLLLARDELVAGKVTSSRLRGKDGKVVGAAEGAGSSKEEDPTSRSELEDDGI